MRVLILTVLRFVPGLVRSLPRRKGHSVPPIWRAVPPAAYGQLENQSTTSGPVA